GGHQLYLYRDAAPGIASTYATLPDTSPFANTLENTEMNFRNTFYWGPRQYANLSTATISSFTTNDFRKARMKHWLKSSPTGVGRLLSLERDPSPESGGGTEGEKIWHDYAGKTNAQYEGTQGLPLLAARILPDGATSFTHTN